MVTDMMPQSRTANGNSPEEGVEVMSLNPVEDVSSSTVEEKVSKRMSARQEQEHNVPMTKTQTLVSMVALTISVFLAALDVTVLATANPSIASHFQSSEIYIWSGAAFSLALAAGGPIWGKLSDIWGRKPLLLSAVFTFFLGSALSGFSTKSGMFLTGRTVQGLGAGGLLVLANICVADLFSMRERPLYYSMFGMVWALASSIGPVLGGVLTDKTSWRWCFWINLPVTFLAFVAIAMFLKLHTKTLDVKEGLVAFDWLGSASLVACTVLILLGLQFGGITYPWGSATVLSLIIVGLALLPVFVLVERSSKLTKNPIIPPRIFDNVSNVCVLIVCFFHGSIVLQASFFLVLYYQSVLGASPILSGVYLLPFVLGVSLSATLSGVYSRITGRYMDTIRATAPLTVLGCGLLTILPQSHQWSKLIIFSLIVGIGNGPNYQALQIALQNNVRPQDIATATSTFLFIRSVASSVGLVIGGVVFQNGMESRQAGLKEILGQTAENFNGKNAEASVRLIAQLGRDEERAVRQVFWESEKNIWYLMTGLAAAGCVAMLGIKGKEMSKVREAVRTEYNEEKSLESPIDRVEK